MPLGLVVDTVTRLCLKRGAPTERTRYRCSAGCRSTLQSDGVLGGVSAPDSKVCRREFGGASLPVPLLPERLCAEPKSAEAVACDQSAEKKVPERSERGVGVRTRARDGSPMARKRQKSVD